MQVEQAVFDLGQQLGGYGNLDAVAGEEVAHQGSEFAQFVAFGGGQGLRAASPCRACKKSYYDQQMMRWDPKKMRLG